MVNDQLLGICGFNSCWVIFTLLQIGSVYHLIWFLVSKFCLGKSYTQDTQEDTMPTSVEGICEILFSDTFLSLYWQARLQLLNCGLPWQFIMTAESQNLLLPLKGPIKTCHIWLPHPHSSPTLCKNETPVSHTQKGVI